MVGRQPLMVARRSRRRRLATPAAAMLTLLALLDTCTTPAAARDAGVCSPLPSSLSVSS